MNILKQTEEANCLWCDIFNVFVVGMKHVVYKYNDTFAQW